MIIEQLTLEFEVFFKKMLSEIKFAERYMALNSKYNNRLPKGLVFLNDYGIEKKIIDSLGHPMKLIKKEGSYFRKTHIIGDFEITFQY
jgi:hypothetical protein